MVDWFNILVRFRLFILVIIGFGCPFISQAQGVSDEKIKAAYTYQFAQNIVWPNEHKLDTFRIVVYSDNPKLINEFKEISTVKFLKNKPIVVYKVDQIARIKGFKPNILYVDNKFNGDLTEESTLKEFVMINFIHLSNEKNKLSFEVNRNAIEQNHNLTVQPKLLLLGGSRLDVANLYHVQEERMKEMQNKVEKYKSEIEKQQIIVDSQGQQIEQQNYELRSQKQEIYNQQIQIEIQKNKLDTLLNEINSQQQVVIDNISLLNKNKDDIDNQRKTISLQVKEMNQWNQILEKQKLEIQNQYEKIKDQRETLFIQQKRIQTQQKFLVLTVSSVVLALGLIFFILLGYRDKQKANKILREKNLAIQEHETEIQYQTKLIDLANKELEEQNQLLERTVEIRTEEYRIAKEKAEEADKLKSAFLANVSHEIRTPLNAIVGYSQILSLQLDYNEEFKGHFDVIMQSSNDLLRLINDIIDISKIESGQLHFNIVDCHLELELETLHRHYNEQIIIENKHHDLRVIYSPDTSVQPLIIKIDPSRIKQVLTNLLSNALKFTDSGVIEFGYKVHKDEIEFFVTDTGIGIPKQFHNDVFQRFRKIKQSDDRLYSGTGLGLVISKSLVELHGGKMWFESSPQQGTGFFFTIPLTYGEALIEKELPKKITLSFAGKTVLICEDDNNSREFLKRILAKLNFKIIAACDGVEAIEMFNNNPDIDVVLLDIQMPRLNGYDTLTEIRKISTRKIPIIAQTAFAMTHEIEKIINSGFDDYISKPIIVENLVDILSKRL
jgi:signal transduction histidine kinase